MSRLQPSNRRIAGIAIVLFASVLIGESLHHLVSTGTCSSNGYTQYGPAPRCPSGTVWWGLFIPLGVIASIAGALVGSAGPLILPALFSAIGLGSLSVVFESSASQGTKAFAGIFGGSFAVVGITVGVSAVSSMLKSSGSGRQGRVRRRGAASVVRRAGTVAPGAPAVIAPGQASASTAEAEASIFGTEEK
jgi:hypothetical protein